MEKHDAPVDQVTEQIIGCAIEVHRTLGPGLLESVYQACLMMELEAARLAVESGRRVPITYKGHRIATDLEVDLLVEGCVVVELKAVEHMHPVHSAQVITYLKLTGCPAGLLLNFNAPSMRAGLKRLSHPNLYAARKARETDDERPS